MLEVSHDVQIAMIDGLHPYLIRQHLDDYVRVFRTGRIKSLMTPLQSGNTRILELMNRRYSQQEFIAMIQALTKAYPDLYLISQIIVGFPSETREEFLDSVQTTLECKIQNMTLFPFYMNPLTEAALLPDPISDEEKFDRVEQGMRILGKQGIFSFNLGCEIDPRRQSVKALYDNA